MRKKKEQENEVFEFITLPSADHSKIKDAKGIPQYSESELYEDLEEKMESLKPKGKKGRRKKIFQIGLLVLVCVLSVFLLLGLGSGGDGTVPIRELFASVRVGYLLIVLLLVVLYIFVESFFVSYLCRITTGRFRPLVSFKTAMLGKYYDNITPLGAGGQPFQMVYLSKNDVPIGVATSIPLIKYFVWAFTNIPAGIVLLLINSGSLSGLTAEMATSITVLAWVGIGLNAFLPIFVLTFTFLPKAGEKAVGVILRIGSKLHLVKNYDKLYDKAVKTVVDFKSSMTYVSKRVLYLLGSFVLMLIGLTLSYSIPYFVVLALTDVAPSVKMWYDILTLSVFSMFASSFIPTPGSSGAAESSAFLVFSGIPGIKGGLLFWIVLLWRLLTYYLYIAIGLVLVFYDFVKNGIKDKIINRKRLGKMREKLIPKLTGQSKEERVAAVTMLRSIDREDRYFAPKPRPNDQKLFLKTYYSNTSFTPSEIAWNCYQAGNKLLGVADLDTVSGAEEFAEACDALDVGCVLGVEIGCYLSRTQKQTLRFNNLYQDGVINLAILGIPPSKIGRVNGWLARYRERTAGRSRKMVDALNDRVEKIGIRISFEDVLRAGKCGEGGTLTERQILVAFANALIERYGRGATLLDALVKKLGIPIPEKTKRNLSDVIGNKNYQSDLVSVLRGEIVYFYVDAEDDLCSMLELVRIANEVGAIVVYPYMGDIEQTVFGELRVQKYEDAFLFELLSELAKLGVRGVTYSRSRHTPEQIDRIKEFADKLNLLELAGETIYNNRQEYEIVGYDGESDERALANAYAILGSQSETEIDKNRGLLSLETADKFPEMDKRLAWFVAIAKEKM